ncbi:inositol monophosphatase 1-like [Zeugodacus cucurbitae]|uniref:inositol monophosphatase 1-like n=1 Tax=Zeugodacus cucurbitae TaxID=28588 RepID=UPI0023D94B00|nr:inositol monophosphatase 1-like [Zeugodacus cucurbitae]
MGDGSVDLNKCFEVVSQLVDKAGALVAKRIQTRQEFEEKANDIDLVTATDREVEQLLIRGLLDVFPDHKFIGEEESAAGGQPNKLTDVPTWIIDPIDGTMNFVHSFPHSCISIGLKVNKVTEIGIVFNPMLGQRFTARRGQGAYLNGRRIHVSAQKELSKSLVITEFGASRDVEKMKNHFENYQNILPKVHGIRMLGAAALNLSMVAMGAVDINFEIGIHAWDVCAGELLVLEAGGVVIDPTGDKFDIMSRRVLAASSEELAQEFAKQLTQFYPQPRDD